MGLTSSKNVENIKNNNVQSYQDLPVLVDIKEINNKEIEENIKKMLPNSQDIPIGDNGNGNALKFYLRGGIDSDFDFDENENNADDTRNNKLYKKNRYEKYERDLLKMLQGGNIYDSDDGGDDYEDDNNLERQQKIKNNYLVGGCGCNSGAQSIFTTNNFNSDMSNDNENYQNYKNLKKILQGGSNNDFDNFSSTNNTDSMKNNLSDDSALLTTVKLSENTDHSTSMGNNIDNTIKENSTTTNSYSPSGPINSSSYNLPEHVSSTSNYNSNINSTTSEMNLLPFYSASSTSDNMPRPHTKNRY